MQHYIDGKSIVITGGNSGFGLEAARLLLEMGARVTITGRNADKLAAAKDDLDGGDALRVVRADATVTADWQSLMADTITAFGALDVLVNNHGGGIRIAPLEELSDEEIAQVLDLNIGSVIRGSREAIRVMKPRGQGHIVNVSSACAHHSWANWSVYTAAKSGMVGYTRCLHREMCAWGGKATTFTPGAARTGFCDAAGVDGSWQEGYPTGADFARTLVHCIDMPANSVIEEVNIWGTRQVADMLDPY